MESVTMETLRYWDSSGRHYLLVDVREPFEHETRNIGGINIPLSRLNSEIAQLPSDQDIVLYCAKGIRSVIAIQRLHSKGFTRLFNLSGGIATIH